MIYKLRLCECLKQWHETFYNVKADNISVAIARVLSKDSKCCQALKQNIVHSELMSVNNNDGEATIQVLSDDNAVIWDNKDEDKEYVILSPGLVNKLVDYTGFDDHVFKGTPLNDSDKNIYFADKKWLNDIPNGI